ncbi:MAG: DUF1311 domain-containing protein [Bauldia sp.]|nr:DUF1311 domain-containing protein [Bauldia sp.]
MRIVLIVAATLMLAAPAVAGDDDDIPGCANASSNVEFEACTYAALEAADRELNDIWPKVLKSIEDRADTMPAEAIATWKGTVIAAQEAWVAFKEADCAAVDYEWWGGSGAGQARIACPYHHTAARVAELKRRYLDR